MLRIHIKHLCHADTMPGTEDTGDKAGKSKVGVGENSSQREGPVEQRCRNSRGMETVLCFYPESTPGGRWRKGEGRGYEQRQETGRGG